MLSKREKQIIDLAVKTAIDKIANDLLLLQQLIDNLKGQKWLQNCYPLTPK